MGPDTYKNTLKIFAYFSECGFEFWEYYNVSKPAQDLPSRACNVTRTDGLGERWDVKTPTGNWQKDAG